MNHPMVSSTEGSGVDVVLQIGTALATLVIPLLLALFAVQFGVQFFVTTRREARRLLERHAEALNRDRQRLIEEIKIDLLQTLSSKERAVVATAAAAGKIVNGPETAREPADGADPVKDDRTVPGDTPTSTDKKQLHVTQGVASAPPDNKYTPSDDWPPARRLDRKECSNIVNEIIYQMQTGSRSSTNIAAGATDQGPNAEDSAILRDVHNRSVVARMKTLFERQHHHHPPPTVVGRREKWSVPTPIQFGRVLRSNNSNSRISAGPARFCSSLENLRSPAAAAGQYPGGSPITRTEPLVGGPAIWLRRRIRSQQSLSESVEDILESSDGAQPKRYSQHASVSDLLPDERSGVEVRPPPPYNRVARGLKTLSTFSLSELLQDDEEGDADDGSAASGTDDDDDDSVVIRPKHHQLAPPPSLGKPPPLHNGREFVDNIEQILIAENLSQDYWKYSISNLLDFLEDDDGGVVCLQEFS